LRATNESKYLNSSDLVQKIIDDEELYKLSPSLLDKVIAVCNELFIMSEIALYCEATIHKMIKGKEHGDDWKADEREVARVIAEYESLESKTGGLLRIYTRVFKTLEPPAKDSKRSDS
jgi:hypothetical protein